MAKDYTIARKDSTGGRRRAAKLSHRAFGSKLRAERDTYDAKAMVSEAHVGTVVDGRYRLDRLLGEGAAGAVYAATQLSVDRVVAVKLLHDANSARFAAEAKAIAKLNHTNVITLHDFGYDAGLGAHFMVTEFAEGVPLSDRMREVMSTDLILRVSLEIASALHHAHANGVMHRDLKPENVILTRADGRVDVAKVLDFGLAHLMDAAVNAEGDSVEPVTKLMSVETLLAGADNAVPAILDTTDDEPLDADASAEPPQSEPEAEPEPEEQPAEEDAVEVTAAMKSADLQAAIRAADARGAQGEPDTAVLPPLDLSADSMFSEEEE